MLALALIALLVALLALITAAHGARAGRDRRTRGSGPDALPQDVLGLRQEVAALRAEAAGAMRHLGVVRYDAFSSTGPAATVGTGGGLSWSLALLDDAGDGVVLTSIHGRSEARSYAKSVAGWHSAQPLSPEEEAAVASARRSHG